MPVGCGSPIDRSRKPQRPADVGRGPGEIAQVAARQPTPTSESTLTALVANGGNVRETPINGRPVDQVNAGETIQLLEKNKDATWYKVTYSRDGKTITGWVSKTLLTIDPAIDQRVPQTG